MLIIYHALSGLRRNPTQPNKTDLLRAIRYIKSYKSIYICILTILGRTLAVHPLTKLANLQSLTTK